MRFLLPLFLLTANAAGQEEVAPPNILFCIADDASQPHFSAYGCKWVKTPAFDRVADEGLLFTNAWTPNAKCAPSRACILTGRNTWQLEEACNHMPFFPTRFRSYVEELSGNGYFCGKTAKGWAPGKALDEKGKQRFLAGPSFNRKKTKPPAQGISVNDYAANFDDFLEQKPDGKPFCFWYGCVEPHRRYEPGVGARLGGKKISDIDHVPAFWPDNETIRNDMLDYAYEIEHFDNHLGRMLKSLEDRDMLENTLVIVTSDNGMPFPRIKGQEYAWSNHLPLALMWKGRIVEPGRVIDDYVSFIDLAPTILRSANVPGLRMQPMTGRSLTEYFETAQEGIVFKERDHVLIGKERHDVGRPNDWGYPIRGIVKEGFLYLRNYETDRWPAGDPITGYLNCDGSPTKTEILNLYRAKSDDSFWKLAFGKRPQEELYDLSKDRDCMTNLADVEKHTERKVELERQMMMELRAQLDPRVRGKGQVFDEYPAASPTANYYERYTKGEKVKAGWVNPSDYEEQPKREP